MATATTQPTRLQYGGTAANAAALMTAAASKVSDALDYEAVAPTVALVEGGDRIYLSNCPVLIFLTHGIRINVPNPGDGTITVQVYAGGLPMFADPVDISGETTLFPVASILPARRSIPAGTRLEVRVESLPDGYGVWYGLRVAFLLRDPDDSVPVAALDVLEDQIAEAQADADLALGLLDELATGGVVLRRVGRESKVYAPTEDTDEFRMLALRAALEEADLTPEVFAVIELVLGGFLLPAGEPMTTYLSAPENVKVVLSIDAPLLYEDPDDTGADSVLFETGLDRDIRYFGAQRSGPVLADGHDNSHAIQCANNSLPWDDVELPYPLPDGRQWRNGKILIPQGTWCFREVHVSPGVHFTGDGILSAGKFRTYLYVLPGTRPDPEDPGFAISYDSPAGVDQNNLFDSRATGFLLNCGADNAGLSGIYMGGAQLCLLDDVAIAGMPMDGAVLEGVYIGTVWIFNCGRMGLDWRLGGSAQVLHVEHCNESEAVDPSTGEKYPALRMSGPYGFQIGFLTTEASKYEQVFVECTDCLGGVHVNKAMLGDTQGWGPHIGFLLRGSTKNVTLMNINPVSGGFTFGSIIKDISYGSINGVGVLYEQGEDLLPGGVGYTGAYYMQNLQKAAGFRAKNNNWSGENRFSRAANTPSVILAGSGTAGQIFAGMDYQYNVTSVFQTNAVVNGSDNFSWVLWKLDLGTIAEWDNTGLLKASFGIQSTTYADGSGNKVLGTRGAAVADATGGAVVDVEARAAINALLARFRVTGGHGSIAD